MRPRSRRASAYTRWPFDRAYWEFLVRDMKEDRVTEPKRLPLLVGEANPYQSNPRLAQEYALYPDPPGCAGHRLQEFVMGLSEHDYLTLFERANLCDGKWSMRAARARAPELIERGHGTYVLCGVKVAAAFGLPTAPFRVWYLGTEFVTMPGTRGTVGREVWSNDATNVRGVIAKAVLLPHPSGLCRVWNEADAVERARALLRAHGLLPEATVAPETEAVAS